MVFIAKCFCIAARALRFLCAFCLPCFNFLVHNFLHKVQVQFSSELKDIFLCWHLGCTIHPPVQKPPEPEKKTLVAGSKMREREKEGERRISCTGTECGLLPSQLACLASYDRYDQSV